MTVSLAFKPYQASQRMTVGNSGCMLSCGGVSMSTYPNPADAELIIESELITAEANPDISTATDETSIQYFTVTLRDGNGNVKKTSSTENGRITLNVADLKEGIILLRLLPMKLLF